MMSSQIRVQEKKSASDYWLKPVSPAITYGLVVWIVLWAIAIIKTSVNGLYLGLPAPFNSPFPAAEASFGDFFGVFSQWKTFEGLGGVGYGVSYFPATYIPVEILGLFTSDPWKALLLSEFVWALTIPLIMWFLRNKGFLTSSIVTILVILSYPSLFIIQTGNIEAWVAFGLLLAAVFISKKKYLGFVIAIGIIGSIKFVPLIFLSVLFVILPFKKSVIFSLYSIGAAVFLNVFALLVLPKGFLFEGIDGFQQGISGMLQSQQMYVDLMVNSPAGMHFGHSFLNGVHALWGEHTLPAAQWGTTIALIIILSYGLIILYLNRIKTMVPVWIIFLISGAVACFSLPTSTDYKLAYLFPAIVLFASGKNQPSKWIPALLLTIFVISPKPWLHVGSDPYANAMVYLTAAGLIFIPLLVIVTSLVPTRAKENVPHYDRC